MFTFIFTFTRWHNPLDWGLVSSVATCLVPWSVIQQQCNMCMRPEFMTLTSCDSVLLHVWHGLEQSLIDDSIDQWRMRLCSCQWWTFWTYFVTMNLFSLYLMNFMFHTMLDAECIILRVHYTSMKCDVSFSLCSVSTLFRWSGHLCHIMCKTVLPAYNSAKYIKIRSRSSRVMITNVLPPFYGSQCTLHYVLHYVGHNNKLIIINKALLLLIARTVTRIVLVQYRQGVLAHSQCCL